MFLWPAIWGFLEDPDEEDIWAAQKQVVLRISIIDRLCVVAVLLAMLSCAGGPHGKPV